MINDVDFNAVIFIVEDGESLFRIAAMKPDFVGDVLRQPLLNKVYAENLFRDLLIVKCASNEQNCKNKVESILNFAKSDFIKC